MSRPPLARVFLFPPSHVLTRVPSSQADDEMDEPYLKGFEWDKDESWTRLKVHLSKNPTDTVFKGGSSKKSKKAKE
jgi:hypothetical protein